MKRGLVTCPWCLWTSVVIADTIEEATRLGQEAASLHNAEAGHLVKPGRKARAGFRRGEPVS